MKISIALLALAAALIIAISGCDKASKTSAEPAPEVPAASVEKPADTATESTDQQPSAEAGQKSGKVQTTSSGLKYVDKKVGTGDEVRSGDEVTVHYKGWLDDGTVFDTSRKSGREPLVFPVGVGAVIKGWDEGLVGMKVGGVRELTIPPDLAYGDVDMGPIPANSTLHFEVEVLATTR